METLGAIKFLHVFFFTRSCRSLFSLFIIIHRSLSELSILYCYLALESILAPPIRFCHFRWNRSVNLDKKNITIYDLNLLSIITSYLQSTSLIQLMFLRSMLFCLLRLIRVLYRWCRNICCVQLYYIFRWDSEAMVFQEYSLSTHIRVLTPQDAQATWLARHFTASIYVQLQYVY